MHRLSVVLFSLIAPTLAGTGAVVALVAGGTTMPPILGAAAIGVFVACPISLWLGKRLGG